MLTFAHANNSNYLPKKLVGNRVSEQLSIMQKKFDEARESVLRCLY